jgi:hypothetical protein
VSMRRAALRIIGGLSIAAAGIGAQEAPATTTVRVHVRDSTGTAVSGADLTIVQGLHDVVVSGSTDGDGRRGLSIPKNGSDYQLVVRRLGYQRVNRFFRVTGRDTIAFDIELIPTIRTLETVTVTAEQDLKRKSYFIDADQIANSDRTLIDASDILTKLKPDMICGRNCQPLAAAGVATQNPARRCPGLVFQQPPRMSCPVDTSPPSVNTNVWVNGRRIRSIIPDEMAMARRTGLLGGLLPGSLTVLGQIKPEHIDQMTYIDSSDNTVGLVGSNDALFIVLKPGIVYEPGRESRLADDTDHKKPQTTANALPSYRYRIMGVFDEETGEPIEGAEVRDVLSGTWTKTTVTGTVSLVFLPEGGSPVRISKAGYEELTVPIEISAETPSPITLTMAKKRAPSSAPPPSENPR